MNQKLLSVLAAVSISLLTSCVAFKESLCPPALRADIPNFEGTYHLKSYDEQKFQITQQTMQVIHIDLGRYRMEASELDDGGGEESNVCRIDNQYILESKNKDGSYQIYGIERRSDGGFNMISYASDVRLLTEHKVPYTIVNSDKRWKKPGSGGDNSPPEKVVLIDNHGRDSQLIFQLIDELAFRIAFVRASSTTVASRSISSKEIDRRSAGKSAGSALSPRASRLH